MTPPLVLIAEDLESHRTLLDLVLASEGYELVMVEDGKAALEWLQTHTPDLVILDVHMPLLSGLEVAERIRRVTRLRDVKVILLTALRDAATREGARLAKADALIMKPLEGKDFRGIVRSVLGGERQPI